MQNKTKIRLLRRIETSRKLEESINESILKINTEHGKCYLKSEVFSFQDGKNRARVVVTQSFIYDNAIFIGAGLYDSFDHLVMKIYGYDCIRGLMFYPKLKDLIISLENLEKEGKK